MRGAWGSEPGPNFKHKIIKRVALTMNYLAQGGTMDQAATALGISRSLAVVYTNQTPHVLSAMAKTFVEMPSAQEVNSIEDGFFAIAGFPGTVGAIDGTLIRIARPTILKGSIAARTTLQSMCKPSSTIAVSFDPLGVE
ncbi:unnamed protein product [Phytophthora fragariaefolia]|uniref:Unnamed protein product n=1 Tax=Phytophthora fragariaefolia TaxID=1490495 RepID=A0A9W6UE16_9STRA|nr:unnamed protein product [Phytophthora fragariaefolia]